MPSERRLQSHNGGLYTGCGFKPDSLEALKKRVESLNECEKLCVIWLASRTFGGDKEKKLPFHEGLILTFHSIHLAAMYLLTEKHFKYVMTSRFNQNIVENSFSCNRQNG